MRTLLTPLSLLLAFIALASVSCTPRMSPAEQAAADTISAYDQWPVSLAVKPVEATLERDLLFDKYTLKDTIPYRDTVRIIRWEQIRNCLTQLDSTLKAPAAGWGVIQNKGNANGHAPIVTKPVRDEYKSISDIYGVERHQSAPLYTAWADTIPPERYGRDGWLVKIISDGADSARIEPLTIASQWIMPTKYLKRIPTDSLWFNHAIFVDRKQQYAVTLERQTGSHWLIRSINPVTTGRHVPPYQQVTPLGIFVIQEKKPRMIFYEDGTTEIGGFAPFASRFCCGAYLHGVPVNVPHTEPVEYSWTLGTTPRSHMCVRNATSHAEFIYKWAPTLHTIVYVIE